MKTIQTIQTILLIIILIFMVTIMIIQNKKDKTIERWIDSSGNRLDLIQENIALQPIRTDSCILFDGSDCLESNKKFNEVPLFIFDGHTKAWYSSTHK